MAVPLEVPPFLRRLEGKGLIFLGFHCSVGV